MPKSFFIKIILVLVSCFFHSQGFIQAQDLHFSQYFSAPLIINPANTGFNPENDYRVGLNYRNQWSVSQNMPYKTMSAWGDAQLMNEVLETGWLGVGMAILKDEAGSAILSSTKVYTNIAYHQLLGENSLLSGGLGFTYNQKSIDIAKLEFNSQWNGKFFDSNLPSNEPFTSNQINYFTVQAGINFSYFPSDKTYYNVGISMHHINRPRESFFNNNVPIKVRYNIFANGSFKVDPNWIVNSNFYYSRMGNVAEYVIGGIVQRNLNNEFANNIQLLAGIYYRVGDAIIPMIGVEYKKIRCIFNYDATVSKLAIANHTAGAYEISIIKSGLYKSAGKSVKCPTISF